MRKLAMSDFELEIFSLNQLYLIRRFAIFEIFSQMVPPHLVIQCLIRIFAVTCLVSH